MSALESPLLGGIDQEKATRRRSSRLYSLCGWTMFVLLMVAWLAGNYVVIQLQIDKSKMTIMHEDQLRKAFFVNGVNESSNSIDLRKTKPKGSSELYHWLVHGSPKEVIPWAELTGDDSQSWLNQSLYDAGHCTVDQIAMLAEGKIDEDRCGSWARPRSDGCAGGFYEDPKSTTTSSGDGGESCSDVRPALSCVSGTFCPAGFTCFVACLYGASCGVSMLDPPNNASTHAHCSWPVSLPHTNGRAYERPNGEIICPGVAYETLCPAGYYCEDPTTVPQSCPKGHFCPEGSYEPKHCPFFTTCNSEKNDAPDIHVAAAAALLGSFAACLLIFQSSRFVRYRMRRLRQAVHEKRMKRREQALERQAARMANRVMQQAPRGLASRVVVEDDDDVEQDQIYLCGTTWLGEQSYNDDDDEDDLSATPRDRRPQSLLELPPHEGDTASSIAGHVNTQAPHSTSPSVSSSAGRTLCSLKCKSGGELVDLEFERLGLGVQAANGRQMRVLEGVTGSFRHGHVSAILGPSGAGKSTLLKILCGRTDRAAESITPGSIIRVNGDESISLSSLAPLCAFVPQEDVMHRELSVAELLEFSAATRLSLDSSSRRAVIRDVIGSLGLHAVRHSVVGDAVKRGISGGQRKRCNLALELCADPCVLFADEVTSGLDSATSLDVIHVLHVLARKRANVVVVLHQPSLAIFDSFTSVLLLAPGGRTAYEGPPKGARKHFDRLDFRCPPDWSPPDYYMQLLSSSASALRVDLAAEWSRVAYATSVADGSHSTDEQVDDRYAASTKADIEAAALDRASPSWLWQLHLQLIRALIRQRRLAWSIAGDVAVQALAGGGIGLLYTDFAFKNVRHSPCWLRPLWIAGATCQFHGVDRCGVACTHFVTVTSAFAGLGMTTTLSAVGSVAKGRAVFIRECCNAGGGGLSASAYFVAVNIADLPRLAALATVFVIAFYPLAHPRASLGVYILAAIGDAFAASGFGYVAGAIFDEQTAQLAALCLALVFTMFSGVHPTISQMQRALRVVHYGSHDRYFVELLFVEEITHMSEAFRMPPSFFASPSSSVLAQLLAYGYLVLEVSDYWVNHYLRWLDLATLIAIGLAARALAFFCLIQFNQAALCRESTWTIAYRSVSTSLQKLSARVYVDRNGSSIQRPWRFSSVRARRRSVS